MDKKMSRTQYSIRNIIFGAGEQAFEVILRFINRTLFIKFLAVEYLGINSLFTEILSVLSLAELGVGSAIVYALYKPLAENDEKKLSTLMHFYKKCYVTIGIVISIIGIALMPFLNVLVDMPEHLNINVYIVYLMFLFNTSFSYFYSYKTSLLGADQKGYILKLIKGLCSFGTTFIQIAILCLTKNYYLYLGMQLLFTVVYNVVASTYVNKHYPFLKNRNVDKLDKKTFSQLVINVRALIIVRVCTIMVNSTDNMIISALKGLKSVGLLSNYTLLVSVLETVLAQIFDNLTASIGNLNAEGDSNKSEKFFNFLNMMNYWFYSFAGVGIFVLGNEIIKLWLGGNYLLNEYVVWILAFNFYIKGMQNAVWNYKNTYGLFKYGRYLSVVTALVNVGLSILLGKYIGIFGVLVATSIARVTTNVWYDPYAVYKYGMKSDVRRYYVSYVKYFVMFTCSLLLTYKVADLYTIFGIESLGLSFIYKLICVILIPNVVTVGLLFKKDEFKYFISKIRYLLKGISEKV